MKLGAHYNAESLAALGAEAVDLLTKGDIKVLGDRFNYMLAYGRPVDVAIQDDLSRCLAVLGATSIAAAERPLPKVSFFKPDGGSPLALVECLAPTDRRGSAVLVELVVIRSGPDDHLYLEDLSPVDETGVVQRP